MSSFRKQRMSDLLLSFLAGEVRSMNDPRLMNVTLTGIDMSPDLKTAWVYWTAFKTSTTSEQGNALFGLNEKEIKEVLRAFHGVTPLLKRRVGKELKLRYTPELTFRYDESGERGARIEELLKRVGAGGNA